MTTLNIRLYPSDALKAIKAIDDEVTEASIQLVSKDNQPAERMTFDLWVNGSDTAHTLTLYESGAWALHTPIVP